MEAGVSEYQRMTSEPVGRLVVSLAIPTVISMLVSAVYNMADTFFVAKLGTSAAAAVGIVLSLMAIIQAIGFTIGMGAGSCISRLLGAHQPLQAGRFASSALLAAFVCGSALTVCGTLLLDGLMRALGATETILPHASAYARYILLAAPVMCASFVLNNVLRAEGKARLAMVGLMAGGVLNCALDPVFIFSLGMGIAGAAMATALSQCVSFSILLSAFLRGRTISPLSPRNVSLSPGVYLQILNNGLPSFCRQGLAGLASVTLNVTASAYGDAAVAGMTIVGKLFMFVYVIVIGIGQGFQPVAGYNFGALKIARVRAAFIHTLKISSAVMTLCAVAGFALAPALMALFISDDEAVVAIGALAIRAQALVMPLVPLGVMCNMTFQSIGKSWTATILSTARQGTFFLPLILLLPRGIGFLGVQIAQPLADLCTFAVSLPVIVYFFNRLAARHR